MTHTVLIPARLQSTRLPEKPLADIAGIPMVVRVAQRVMQADAADAAARVVVAADHARIVQVCRDFGIEAILTDSRHASGSDRLAQACALLQLPDDAIVVNVQGDEPLIDPELIARTARQLAESGADIATVAHPITSPEEFFNPAVVQVVCRADGDALYFSRAPIPYARDHFARTPGRDSLPAGFQALRHIGLYAYRARFLRAYADLTPSYVEGCEALEQLRALWHGYRISVTLADDMPLPGVDTPEDAARVRAYFAGRCAGN